MNPNSGKNIMPLISIVGGMMVALYVAASILLDNGNQLAGLFFYALLGSGLMGLLAPRAAFFFFLIQTAYLDLLKRLMVIGGNVSFVDLFWVLGIAPVTIAGIASGLLVRMIFGQTQATRGDVRRLATAVVLNGLLAVLVYVKGGGIGGTVREVANGSSYALLLFIVPLLFRTPESVAGCTRFLLFLFVPAAAYTVYQQIFGFQEFEIEYLKSGLSIEVKQLEADRVRAFGTLNSPTSISVVAASLAAMATGLLVIGRRDGRLGLSTPLAIGLVALTVAAWAASTVRVGILLLPVAVIGTFVFSRPGATRAFYAVLVGGLMALVAASGYLYQNVEIWTSKLGDFFGGSGSYLGYMLNLNSYKDRLYGFYNVLLNPDAYSLFGMPHGGEDGGFVVHDPLSSMLLSYGVIPLVAMLLIAAAGTWRLHRVIFVMRNRTLQLFAASFLANAAGNVAVSLVNGNLLGTFPVNVFFWVSLAFAITLRQADEVLAKQPQAQPLPSHPGYPAGMRGPMPVPMPMMGAGGGKRGRFAPVAMPRR